MVKSFSFTRVYTKNIVTDSFQGIRNFFGLRLRGYEKMINNGTEEVLGIAQSHGRIKWWRMTINPLLKGSVMITVYGEYE